MDDDADDPSSLERHVSEENGTRVLPIFVLSLVDVPMGLQFRDGGLMFASSRAVLVLQVRHQQSKRLSVCFQARDGALMFA